MSSRLEDLIRWGLDDYDRERLGLERSGAKGNHGHDGEGA